MWERPLTTSDTPREAAEGLQEAMAETARTLGAALQQAEDVYREMLRPRHVATVESTLSLLREGFAPHFPAMARRQSEVLELDW